MREVVKCMKECSEGGRDGEGVEVKGGRKAEAVGMWREQTYAERGRE